MAYRKLVVGDLVRVVDRGPNHGRDAVVVEASQSNVVKIQMVFGRTSKRIKEKSWVNQKHLLIRHSEYEFIFDGKLDEEARKSYHELKQIEVSSYIDNNLHEDDDIDWYDDGPCGDCLCCVWHRKNS